MKTLLLVALLGSPILAQTATYDKFKDHTVVSTETVTIDRPLTMTVKAIHQGESLAKLDDLHCYLVFRSSSRSWQFLRSHGLIFLADGERINLGDGSHDGRVGGGRYVSVSETMIYTISRADLEKLAKSTTLEMKLGYLEAKLDEDDKQGMKELLGYPVKK